MSATAQPKLSGKVILVTGAAGSIGGAVSQMLASQGATIILLDKQIPALEKRYDLIKQASYPEPAIYPLDLKGAAVSDYDTLVHNIEQQIGRLDGLIHCAAMLGQLAPFAHQDPKLWAEVIHVNLTAPSLLTRACLPLLSEQRESFVTFTGDDQAAKAYWGAYGISKNALITLCEQLAAELSATTSITVNGFMPGKVSSEIHKRAFPAASDRHLPTVEEMATYYLALSGPAGKTFHGQFASAADLPRQMPDETSLTY